MSHFGIKPVRGGRPPSDNNIRGINAVMIGVLDHEMANELMLVALFSLSTRNVEEVIIK